MVKVIVTDAMVSEDDGMGRLAAECGSGGGLDGRTGGTLWWWWFRMDGCGDARWHKAKMEW